MFDEIEYVDPADSKCDECGCSFDVHQKTCSKFVQLPVYRSEDRPQPKFKAGQVVAMKGIKKQPVFKVLEVVWAVSEWAYRWNGRNAASEHMLRELTPEEKG